MHYKNLTLIGTSHIAKESMEEVQKTIKKLKPDIVALELDRRRFFALINNTQRKPTLKDIRRIGFKGYMFNIIGAWIEKKLGKYVGVKPGSEMITAIKLAKEKKIKIALIDQDIEITLTRISKEFTWKEKLRLVIDFFKGIFFRKAELKKLGIKNLDLSKVPSKTLIRKLIQKVKVRYPNFYKVLVEERNVVMANNIHKLMLKNPDKKILAIIGAGHEEELLDLIKNMQNITYSFKVS